MNALVQEYLNKNKDELKKRLCEELRLYELQKEYAPDNITDWRAARDLGFDKFETIDGKERYYSINRRVYPELTDEEYRELLAVSQAQKGESLPSKSAAPSQTAASEELRLTIDPVCATEESHSATYLKALAVITWILGLIVAIVSARVPTGYRSETQFSFSLFLIYAAAFFGSGMLFWIMGDVIQNIRDISAKLSGFTVRKS